MDPHPTPFPGISHSRKPKFQRKSSEAPKSHVKEALFLREKRVFGTARNPNVITKTVPERAKKNAVLIVPVKSSVNPSTEISKTPKKSPAQKGGKIKKTVIFKEKVEENKEKKLGESNVSGAQTPSRSPFLMKPRALGTPFMSAEKCSKCRFDKLETSSYWIAQIKLAESVAKHFASAVFFKLALQCRAEPQRNIKVELKKYLGRHEDLGNEEEWKGLSIGYGLLKDESRLCNQEYEEEEEEGKIESTKIICEVDKNIIDQESKEDAGGEQI